MSQLVSRPVYAPRKPERDAKYLDWVRGLPCAVTGRPAECAHHIRGHGFGTTGSKASDYLTMPLINALHCQQQPGGIHRIGVDEWEAKHGSQWEHIARTLYRYMVETKG